MIRFSFALVILACACNMTTPSVPDLDGGTRDMSAPPNGADLAVSNPLCTDAPQSLDASKQRSRACGVGFEAALLLRATPYSKLRIEIGSTVGTTPRQAAIDHLITVFQDLTGKTPTVTLDPPVAAPGHPLTLDEVVAIEDQTRTLFGAGDTGVFYYFVAGESYAQDSGNSKVLGLAYRTSSMVIFEKTIASISGGIGQPSSDVVEKTVVAHELGHILGLVNLGAPMVQPHQDTAHGGHDTNTSCIMYYANNSSALLQNILSGGVTPDFDANCRADLAALR